MKKRSTTLHRGLSRGTLDAMMAASVLRKLPVVAKDQPKKMALLRELAAVERAEDAAARRLQRVAKAIARLKIVRTLVEM